LLEKKSRVKSTFVPCASEMSVILKEKADALRKKLILQKSGERYHKEMEIFRNWRQINGVDKIDEDVILAYVSELVSLEVSVTQIALIMVFYLVQEVCGVFSFDKNIYGGDHMLLTYGNVDISSYSVVKSFMKRNSSGYVPKMSYVCLITSYVCD
jgi:hypothetical protein